MTFLVKTERRERVERERRERGERCSVFTRNVTAISLSISKCLNFKRDYLKQTGRED